MGGRGRSPSPVSEVVGGANPAAPVSGGLSHRRAALADFQGQIPTEISSPAAAPPWLGDIAAVASQPAALPSRLPAAQRWQIQLEIQNPGGEGEIPRKETAITLFLCRRRTEGCALPKAQR